MRPVSYPLFAVLLAAASLAAPAAPAQACTFDCFEESPTRTGGGSFGGSFGAIAAAKKYLGTNPTGRSRLWCAHFMNMIERKMGRSGTGSGLARSYASYGRRVSNPRPGDIAVLRRKGGGHVGYVMSVSGSKVTIISGNHGRKVGVGSYPRSRVIAFVRP